MIQEPEENDLMNWVKKQVFNIKSVVNGKVAIIMAFVILILLLIAVFASQNIQYSSKMNPLQDYVKAAETMAEEYKDNRLSSDAITDVSDKADILSRILENNSTLCSEHIYYTSITQAQSYLSEIDPSQKDLKKDGKNIEAQFSDMIEKANNLSALVSKEPAVTLESISLNTSDINLSLKETYQLQAAVAPEGASVSDLEWNSSDSSICSVDSTGLVTAVGNGEATITVSSPEGNISAQASVTVSKTVKGQVSSMSLSTNKITLRVGEGQMPLVTMLPEDAEDKGEIWETSDKNIANVNSQGLISGISPGTCNVTVTSTSNPAVKQTVSVTVTAE